MRTLVFNITLAPLAAYVYSIGCCYNFIRILSNADPRRATAGGWPLRTATHQARDRRNSDASGHHGLLTQAARQEPQSHTEIHNEADLKVVEELCDNISN